MQATPQSPLNSPRRLVLLSEYASSNFTGDTHCEYEALGMGKCTSFVIRRVPHPSLPYFSWNADKLIRKLIRHHIIGSWTMSLSQVLKSHTTLRGDTLRTGSFRLLGSSETLTVGPNLNHWCSEGENWTYCRTLGTEPSASLVVSLWLFF